MRVKPTQTALGPAAAEGAAGTVPAAVPVVHGVGAVREGLRGRRDVAVSPVWFGRWGRCG